MQKIVERLLEKKTENKISLRAYAKVNLGLDVVGTTEKGYHLLRSVMQQVDLFDVITIEKIPNIECDYAGFDSRITVIANNDEIPVDRTNLVYRAAEKIMIHSGMKENVKISIDKRIPIAAGMAGGSTDAAATFIGMNELFDLQFSLEQLMDMGVTIGADIPFCIMGNTALAEGIGEILTPITTVPEMTLLITKPKLNVSTKYVYEHLDMDTIQHPDTEGLLDALKQQDLRKMISCMSNVLESVTGEEYPIIGELENAILETGADGAIMSGSGPTVFGIYADGIRAFEAEQVMSEKYPDIFVKAVHIRTE
ncbi:MAG: 4-(cytidine 5'-diphospho)-2-C-methyl-D-erythritol kinase [Lachnospiraceae bacterium]